MSSTYKGIDAVIKALDMATAAAAEEIMHAVQAEAQKQAPVATGALRESAETKLTKTVTGIKVTTSFNTPYALKQHEEADYQHKNGGKAKYLSDPFTSIVGGGKGKVLLAKLIKKHGKI